MAPLLPLAASILPAATDVLSKSAAASPAAGAGGVGFTQALSSVAGNAVSALGEAEKAAIAGVAGKASIQDVVTKVMAAERALQTAVSLRDRFVASIQEVSRMQI